MIRAIKGTRDLMPPSISVWNHVETVAREAFRTYNYEEIRTPIFEETALFARGARASNAATVVLTLRFLLEWLLPRTGRRRTSPGGWRLDLRLGLSTRFARPRSCGTMAANPSA